MDPAKLEMVKERNQSVGQRQFILRHWSLSTFMSGDLQR